jgi:hypothetical protein
VWLSLTPEPERELPAAIAVLRAGPGRPDVAGETARAEALVLHGSEPRYLAWLAEAAQLAARGASSDDPAVAHAADVVRDVVANQAGLLLGLPGGGRRRDFARRALETSNGTAP